MANANSSGTSAPLARKSRSDDAVCGEKRATRKCQVTDRRSAASQVEPLQTGEPDRAQAQTSKSIDVPEPLAERFQLANVGSPASRSADTRAEPHAGVRPAWSSASGLWLTVR